MDIRELPGVEAVIKDKGGPAFIVLRYSTYRNFINKLPLTGTIDEADYLKRHSDVAKAIAERKVASARDHYVRSGYFEMRKVKLPSASGPGAANGQRPFR